MKPLYGIIQILRISSTPNPGNPMKTIKVSRERAIIIASNHNNISLEKAKSYTDSELREVLRHLNLKPGF